MNEQTMTIREMCEKFGVTPRTLRFYESKELLTPIRDGQKRLFTKRDRARLTLILRGKRFGFSLEDIRQLLDMYGMGEAANQQLARTVDLARLRLAEMEEQGDAGNQRNDEKSGDEGRGIAHEQVVQDGLLYAETTIRLAPGACSCPVNSM